MIKRVILSGVVLTCSALGLFYVASHHAGKTPVEFASDLACRGAHLVSDQTAELPNRAQTSIDGKEGSTDLEPEPIEGGGGEFELPPDIIATSPDIIPAHIDINRDADVVPAIEEPIIPAPPAPESPRRGPLPVMPYCEEDGPVERMPYAEEKETRGQGLGSRYWLGDLDALYELMPGEEAASEPEMDQSSEPVIDPALLPFLAPEARSGNPNCPFTEKDYFPAAEENTLGSPMGTAMPKVEEPGSNRKPTLQDKVEQLRKTK